MIEHAYIMGDLGKAAYLDAGNWFILDADGLAPGRPCRRGEVEWLFEAAHSISEVTAGSMGVETLRLALKDEAIREEALAFAVAGLDPDLADETRGETIALAEELMTAEPKAAAFVRARLLGRPRSAAADPHRAAKLADDGGAVGLAGLYHAMIRLESALNATGEAWGRYVRGHFATPEAAAGAASALCDAGVFADFAEAVGNTTALGKVYFRWAADSGLKVKLPQPAKLLAALQMELTEAVPVAAAQAPLPAEEDEPADPMVEMIDAYLDDIRRRRVNFEGTDGVPAEVEHSLGHISHLLQGGDLLHAERATLDLIRRQTRSKKTHMAKSLCAVATLAMDCGFADFADRLVGCAERLNVDDPVVGCVRARRLGQDGRYAEALLIFDQVTAQFPNHVVARGGRAETLRALGRLDEALAVYDETIQTFPTNEVTRNGRAETLRELGSLEEALAAYDATAQAFPSDVVARAGRAETLRELGRLGEALAAYGETVKAFPGDVVARAGRAETLREQGRLDEALAAYDATVKAFPANVVARGGRAETLRELGRLGEALAAYEETTKGFPASGVARNGLAKTCLLNGDIDRAIALVDLADPVKLQDWYDYHLAAMAHLRAGRLDEALRRLRHGADHAPWRSRGHFHNALAYALLRSGDFHGAAQEAHQAMGVNAVTASILRGHALAAGGESRPAADILGWLKEPLSSDAILARDLIRRRFVLEEGMEPPLAELSAELDSKIDCAELALLLDARRFTRPFEPGLMHRLGGSA